MVDIRSVNVGDMLRVDDDIAVDFRHYVVNSMLQYAGKTYEVVSISKGGSSIVLDTDGAHYSWHPDVLNYTDVLEIDLDGFNFDDLYV